MGDASNCINCGRAVVDPDQKFCPACGQPTPVHRIDWHFLGHELEHSVLHMDRGILYSLKELMLRPGHLMRSYLEGRRAKQVKPLLLIMVMTAVVVVVTRFVMGEGVMDSVALPAIDKVNAGSAGQVDPEHFARAMTAVGDWMSTHFAAFTLLLLPLEAAAFHLSFWRVGKLNYPEWLVITAFLTVQTLVLWLLLMPLRNWLSPMQVQFFTLVGSIGYGVFSLVQFFGDYPRWKSVLRALLGFGIFMLVNNVIAGVLGVVVFVMSLRA